MQNLRQGPKVNQKPKSTFKGRKAAVPDAAETHALFIGVANIRMAPGEACVEINNGEGLHHFQQERPLFWSCSDASLNVKCVFPFDSDLSRLF